MDPTNSVRRFRYGRSRTFLISLSGGARIALTFSFLLQTQNVIDWDEHTVVGTSTKLEKPYLRLTSVSTSTGVCFL